MSSRGILEIRDLPDESFDSLWEKIIVSDDLKSNLVGQVLLEMTVRRKVDPAAIPLHGIILLVGPPGTGKTSLAKAVASQAAKFIKGKSVRFIEIEPHALAGSGLGKSQQAVRDLLQNSIAEHAAQGPLIVLLDEVETLAADRNKMSLEANPIDVHRATDAMLASLDLLARNHPDLLFVATSNFEKAIDEAFLSRADAIFRVQRPDLAGCAAILKDSLKELGKTWPNILDLANGAKFMELAESAVGLDGRKLRKSVLAACALRKETAVDPGKLKFAELKSAIALAKEGR